MFRGSLTRCRRSLPTRSYAQDPATVSATPKPRSITSRTDAALDGAVFTVDLERQEVARPNGERLRFEIKPFRRRILLDGLDDIALTLKRASAIDALERRQ